MWANVTISFIAVPVVFCPVRRGGDLGPPQAAIAARGTPGLVVPTASDVTTHTRGRGERAYARSHWLVPGRAAEVSRGRHVGPLGGGFERAAGPRPWRRRRAGSGRCSGRSVLGLRCPQAALPQELGWRVVAHPRRSRFYHAVSPQGPGWRVAVPGPSLCVPSGSGVVSPCRLTLSSLRRWAGGWRSLPLSPCRLAGRGPLTLCPRRFWAGEWPPP